MNSLKDSKIIICGIVRNAELGLLKNKPEIDALCRMCKDYHIVIYENDSTDNTKQILQKWAETDMERIHVLLNDIDKEQHAALAEEAYKHVKKTFSLQQMQEQYEEFYKDYQN